MNRWPTFFRCIAACMGAAILYGIVHDMVTAHVCVEYFTLAHEKYIDSTSPVVVGLLFGVISTWWAGAALGILVGYAAARGEKPPLPVREVVRMLTWMLCILFSLAMLAGAVGYHVGGNVSDDDLIKFGIADERIARFWFDVWAHLASYGGGLAGGVILALVAYRKRAISA
ncbi:hypothetical protein BH09SUM1_BH09SUM1_19540 [soil metagenome]